MPLPRQSGILLHPSSLPGPHGAGDLGAAAYHFVDWLAAGEQSLWQVLPLGGVGPGNAARFSQAGLTVGSASYDGAPAPAAIAGGTRSPAGRL